MMDKAGPTDKGKALSALKGNPFTNHPTAGVPGDFGEKGDGKGGLTACVRIQPDPEPPNPVKVVLSGEFDLFDKIAFPAPQQWERSVRL